MTKTEISSGAGDCSFETVSNSTTEILATSYAEVLRTGVLAMRSLGLSFSEAERASLGLARTLAVRADALSEIRTRQEQIASCSARGTKLIRRASNLVEIDCYGKNLVQVGPSIAEFLVALGSHGEAAVEVKNTRSIHFLVDMAFTLEDARSKFICVYATGCRNGQAELGWCGYRTAEESIIGGAIGSVGELKQFYGRVGASIEEKLFLGDGDVAMIFIVGQSLMRIGDLLDCLLPRQAELNEDGCASDRQKATNWRSRYQKGVRSSIVVPSNDLGCLTALSSAIWQPTSERSRRQQGYMEN